MIVLSNEIQKYFLFQRQLYIFNTKCIYEVFFLLFEKDIYENLI